jgi:hypothetical protein
MSVFPLTQARLAWKMASKPAIAEANQDQKTNSQTNNARKKAHIAASCNIFIYTSPKKIGHRLTDAKSITG